MRRAAKVMLTLVAAFAAGALLVPPVVADPATLAGEFFTVSVSGAAGTGVGVGGGCNAVGCVHVSATCNSTGTSTFTFDASGPATGPFPGTFAATGTATIGPQTLAPPPGSIIGPSAGPNLSFSETFTITSGTTTISGTKNLASGPVSFVPAGGLGSCVDFSGVPEQPGHNWADEIPATYTATGADPSGGTGLGGDAFVEFGSSNFCGTNPFCENDTWEQGFVTSTPFLICNENAQANQPQPGNDQGCANP